MGVLVLKYRIALEVDGPSSLTIRWTNHWEYIQSHHMVSKQEYRWSFSKQGRCIIEVKSSSTNVENKDDNRFQDRNKVSHMPKQGTHTVLKLG